MKSLSCRKPGAILYMAAQKYDFSPTDLYSQKVISEYLKQQRKETTMKTEQEQIEEIEKVLKYSVADYKHLKEKGMCYCYAETLIESGYGNISEYKAEIERLRQEVRDTDKMARNTIEQYRAKNEELENALKQSEDNYSRAFERLKAQQREIERLKADLDHQIDATNDAENLVSYLQKDEKQTEVTMSDINNYSFMRWKDDIRHFLWKSYKYFFSMGRKT